jgi:hypothetical protein
MDLKGRRQSTNVIEATQKDYTKGDVDQRSFNSKVLRSKKPLVDQPAETGTRVGTLEVGMDTGTDTGAGDFQFFKHKQKDNI